MPRDVIRKIIFSCILRIQDEFLEYLMQYVTFDDEFNDLSSSDMSHVDDFRDNVVAQLYNVPYTPQVRNNEYFGIF